MDAGLVNAAVIVIAMTVMGVLFVADWFQMV